MVKTVAIVQARMGSTRLPGKVMQDIGGETMLARVVRRARRAVRLDELLVATSTNSGDDVLVAECARLGVACARGSEDDVLDRYYCAATSHDASRIVRITADCPLIDPDLVDEVIARFEQSDADYASNTLERTFPRGLDTEVVSAVALARAWREAREPYQRAHVTAFLYEHPEIFRLAGLRADADYSALRWTVDTPDDLALVRAIYMRLGNDDHASWRAVLDLVEAKPELTEMNRSIRQKELREG